MTFPLERQLEIIFFYHLEYLLREISKQDHNLCCNTIRVLFDVENKMKSFT